MCVCVCVCVCVLCVCVCVLLVMGPSHYCGRISGYREVTIVEMYTLGLGDGEDGSKWQRRLLAWKEEQIGECSMLTDIFLEDGVKDKWAGASIQA